MKILGATCVTTRAEFSHGSATHFHRLAEHTFGANFYRRNRLLLRHDFLVMNWNFASVDRNRDRLAVHPCDPFGTLILCGESDALAKNRGLIIIDRSLSN